MKETPSLRDASAQEIQLELIRRTSFNALDGEKVHASLLAHRDLESLVHSRELMQVREPLGRRFAELVYMGLWFHDVRRAMQSFFHETQRFVTGEVSLKLYKGSCSVLGRRSPHSLYDSRLANQTNLELFDNQWAQGFTSLWTLPSRLAARQQPRSEKSGS